MNAPLIPKASTAYLLRVLDAAMSPRLLPGEWVVADPGIAPLPGDDVVVKTAGGVVTVRQLVALDSGTATLSGLTPIGSPVTHWLSEIVFIHYVAARLPVRALATADVESRISEEAAA